MISGLGSLTLDAVLNLCGSRCGFRSFFDPRTILKPHSTFDPRSTSDPRSTFDPRLTFDRSYTTAHPTYPLIQYNKQKGEAGTTRKTGHLWGLIGDYRVGRFVCTLQGAIYPCFSSIALPVHASTGFHFWTQNAAMLCYVFSSWLSTRQVLVHDSQLLSSPLVPPSPHSPPLPPTQPQSLTKGYSSSFPNST